MFKSLVKVLLQAIKAKKEEILSVKMHLDVFSTHNYIFLTARRGSRKAIMEGEEGDIRKKLSQ